MRGVWGRAAIAVCAMSAWGALAVSATAQPPRPQPHQETTTSLAGPLTIAWSGDPARDCAAPGMCGVSGSVQMRFGRVENETSGGNVVSFSGGDPELVEGTDSAVARVHTTAPDGSVTTCADPLAASMLVVLPRGLGPPPAGDRFPDVVQLPSAGRCAGPTAADLSNLLLPLRRDAHGYDLSGSISLTAGPFAVTLDSGLRVNVIRHRLPVVARGGGSSGEITPLKTRTHLVEGAKVTYRVTGITGALTTDFAGLAPPRCDGLGACGAQGQLEQSFATHGALSFRGMRIVARSVGRRDALADMRQGRLSLSDTMDALLIRGHVSETSSQTGGLRCRDTSSFVLPSEYSRSRRDRDELTLAGGASFDGSVADPFRTRCPGPNAADVLGNAQAIARATVTAGRLGDRRLSITFHGDGPFSGIGYAGRRTGGVVMSLRLEHSSGGTRREISVAGETVGG